MLSATFCSVLFEEINFTEKFCAPSDFNRCSMVVKLTVAVKLQPTSDQADVLAATLRTVNDVANDLSSYAQEAGIRGRFALQRACYETVKASGLAAQAALHVIRKVADAYTVRDANLKAGNFGPSNSSRCRRIDAAPIRFRSMSAQPYDDRCLSWQMDSQTVSIWTIQGRVKSIGFVCSARQLETLRYHRRGESDLVHRDGMWFLYATCDVPEVDLIDPNGWVGVDLGIVNIATTSTGYRAAGGRLNRYRERQRKLRSKLQSKGTKSAKRVLKRLRRKEARRAADVNHVVSKSIVTEAQRTGRGIGLEELTGIRDRVRLRKPQRIALHSWGFAQLGAFIEYKAQRTGVPVVFVDARYTSQTCRKCQHVDKRNRVAQNRFCCRLCGFVEHADVNASHNIAAKAARSWKYGARSTAPVLL